MSTLSDLLTSLASATTSSGVTNLIGKHLVQQGNMQTSVKALVALATPENASQIAGQIAALPGVPPTVTPLLGELATAKDQATVTAVSLQIEAALSANNGVLGSVLQAL